MTPDNYSPLEQARGFAAICDAWKVQPKPRNYNDPEPGADEFFALYVTGGANVAGPLWPWALPIATSLHKLIDSADESDFRFDFIGLVDAVGGDAALANASARLARLRPYQRSRETLWGSHGGAPKASSRMILIPTHYLDDLVTLLK